MMSRPAVEKDESSCELLGCPNEGCVKMYQRHSSLEKHLLFGQCKMVAEKETLYEIAMKKYHALLADGTSEAVSATPDQGHTFESASPLPEGWALKTTKKATRFNDAQKSYLEEKFNLGQATSQKQDPNVVARDMRFARNMDGTKRFKSDDYLKRAANTRVFLKNGGEIASWSAGSSGGRHQSSRRRADDGRHTASYT
ncbi:uncharacterized protein LOC144651323 [Oculina patagonica]